MADPATGPDSQYQGAAAETRRRRVRYWSALALLRCVSSSPAAAAATLRSRAAVDQAEGEDVDEVGRRTVLDQGEDDDPLTLDFSPGSAVTSHVLESLRRRLLEFARRAEALQPAADHKLQGGVREVKALLKDGFQPVVFCRFVDTAEYVARHLREALPERTRVEAVTGLLPPAEREARIANLASEGGQYVLVCTDCLSEGINLQESFNAILHYDLAWNPTRHEQREGRVDRFGQEKPEVRVVTYYGVDNPIDGVILDVLIRKHKTIKSDLGVTVAVPGSSEQVAEALFEAALFRQGGRPNYQQLTLDFIDDLAPKKDKLHAEWENARDREKVSRSRFAQHTLAPEAVAEELGNVRAALGGRDEVARFLESVLQAANVPHQTRDQTITVNLSLETPRSLRQALGRDEPFTGRLDLPLRPGEVYLGRTSPVIEGLAGWTLDQALDPVAGYDRKVASRCGILSTSAVSVRTTLLVTRFRYHLRIASGDSETTLVEEILPMACRGPADSPEWLSPEVGEALLLARPERNLVQTAMEQQLGLLLPALPKLQVALVPLAQERAALQLATHERVREASRTKGRVSLEPILPVDILGAYVLLPRLS